MVETVISIRPARLGDEADIASVHDAAWREAYRGVIPGRELERMIARRGPAWWRLAIARRTPLLVLEFGEVGRRLRQLRAQPSAGARFRRRDLRALSRAGMPGLRLRPAHVRGGAQGPRRPRLWVFVVWALADNERALGFYRRLGGRIVRRAHETFGGQERERVAFGFG